MATTLRAASFSGSAFDDMDAAISDAEGRAEPFVALLAMNRKVVTDYRVQSNVTLHPDTTGFICMHIITIIYTQEAR